MLTALALTIGLHVASWHDQPGYQNFNPGVYVSTESGWTAGLYRNSFERTTVYAAHAWHTPAWNRITGAVAVGAATGYGKTLRPIVVPSAAWNGLRVAVIPRAEKRGATTVHLMIETTLKD